MIWINADDFGLNETISDTIIKCFESGYLTTTTACVNFDYFYTAMAKISKTKYRNCVGIHVNLTEGRPLTEKIKSIKCLCKDGQFIGFPERNHFFNKFEQKIIYEEIAAQIQKFLSLGFSIHHLDSHHHVHNAVGLFPIFIKICVDFNIEKIRIFRNVGKISLFKRIIKSVYNRKLKSKAYSKYMGSFVDLKTTKINKKYIYELMIHPDTSSEGLIIDRNNDDYSNPIGTPIIEIINYLADNSLEII